MATTGQGRRGVDTATPHKVCETCGRRFAWRRKWADVWEEVRYCSAACRGGPGREGRALEDAILRRLRTLRPGATICPSEIARARYPDAWRDQMEAVRRAARRLAHRGKLDITQRGCPVDPDTLRGPIRLRLRPDGQ